MRPVNPFPNRWRLIIAASLVAAAVMLAMLATGMTASAESDNPQKAPVTGLSATSGSNPGEIDVRWDAHPAGAVDYRVAWKPVGERFRPASDTDWNANPTATGMTITGLTEGSEYKVKVRARFDSNPRSRWSSVATATAASSSQPDPPPPVIQPPEPTPPLETAEGHSSPHHLSISDASATEGDDITFTVTLNPVSTDSVTFGFATSIESDDNAEGNDFTPAVGSSFTILAGQTSRTFTVPTQDDGHNTPSSVYEGDETFTITISNPTNAEIAQATAKGTIIDDEDVPTASFEIGPTSFFEGAGTVNNVLIINTSNLNERDAQLSLAVSGTAVADEDYVALPQTLTVSRGQRQIERSISIIDDSIFEDPQTIEIRIAAASDNIQVDPAANAITFTINDNDNVPHVSASAQDGTEGGQNAGTTPIAGQDFANVVFRLNVDPPHQATITMRVQTIEKTAIAGLDYQEPPTTFRFEPGEITKYIKVPVIDDDQYERRGTETFTLRLYQLSYGGISSALDLRITGRIIDNEEPGPVPEGDYVTADRNTSAYIDVGESWLNGNPVPGRIEEQNDQDWYLTNLRAGRCYQIEIRGKSDAEGELPGAEGLTLTDPYLNGVYRDDGVYLPGTTNRDGGVDLSAAPYHPVQQDRRLLHRRQPRLVRRAAAPSTFRSINLGARTKTCTEVDLDNLTYKPGTFDSK